MISHHVTRQNDRRGFVSEQTDDLCGSEPRDLSVVAPETVLGATNTVSAPQSQRLTVERCWNNQRTTY